MNDSCEAQYNALCMFLKSYSELKKYDYYSTFCKNWLRILKQYSIHDYVFITKEVEISDQVFVYCFDINDVPFTLSFLIPYVRKMFQIDTNLFKKCNLKVNNELRFNNEICEYNHYERSELRSYYNDLDNSFFTCVYGKKPTYLVIDGNHRISYQINNQAKEISSYYCPSEIAARSLCSAFQAAVYICLEDCYKIVYSKSDKIFLKRNLSIFDPNSFINNIKKRIKPENKL